MSIIFKNSILKNKGTVILLALFVLFFTASIITLIYSYNVRIFKLAQEERKNYKTFHHSYLEANTNLYMVKLMNYGYIFENWNWNLLFNGFVLHQEVPDKISYIKERIKDKIQDTILQNIQNNLQGKANIYNVELNTISISRDNDNNFYRI